MYFVTDVEEEEEGSWLVSEKDKEVRTRSRLEYSEYPIIQPLLSSRDQRSKLFFLCSLSDSYYLKSRRIKKLDSNNLGL